MQRPCSRRCMICICCRRRRLLSVLFHLRVSGGCWLPGQHLPPAVARCMSRRTDGSHFSLSSVWKPLAVPRFCEVVSAVCVVHGDVVNVPDAGRECWSSCSVSVVTYASDRLKSQIEIVDQRLCKRRHYSAQKVHSGLYRIKSTSQSFVCGVKRSSYFSLWQKLCNLTENQWFWSIFGAELPLSDSWDSFLVSRR